MSLYFQPLSGFTEKLYDNVVLTGLRNETGEVLYQHISIMGSTGGYVSYTGMWDSKESVKEFLCACDMWTSGGEVDGEEEERLWSL